MEEKKIQSHGDVKYRIDITMEYRVCKWDKRVLTDAKVRKTASLDCGFFSDNGFSVGEVVKFQTAANQLLALTKSLLAGGIYVEFTLTKSAHENVPKHEETGPAGSYMSTLSLLCFDCWSFKGNCLDGDPDEEGSGLYLTPDPKYTKESWDICLPWNQDILKSLAEANL